MEKKFYTINGKKYSQNFLTIQKTIRLARLFDQKVDLQNLNPLGILEKLQQTGKIEQFFNIILTGEKKLKENELPIKTAVEILKDFFVLNSVSEIIGTVLELMSEVTEDENLAGLMTSIQTKSTGTNSSPLPRTETPDSTNTSETAST